MSSISDENVPHEGAHAAATDAQMARTSDHAAIPDLTLPRNNNYSQTEANEVAGKVNEILDVLRDAQLIP